MLKSASDFISFFTSWETPSESFLEIRGAFPGSQAALGHYSVYCKWWRWESWQSDSGSYRHRSGLFPAASVAGADTAWTQSPARPLPQASCPAGLPPVPLPLLGSTSLGPCGPLTHSSPSPLTGMGKSSWCRFPEEGSSVPVPGTPVEGDPIHAEAEGSSRRCRCSWWLEDLSACPLCGLTWWAKPFKSQGQWECVSREVEAQMCQG